MTEKPLDGEVVRPSRFSPQQLALLIAIVADLAQIVAFPLFFEGAASVADDVLDVIVLFALTRLLGFHVEFLPSLAAELLPGVDLIPCWTIAVWLVVRRMPKVLPEPPLASKS